jgi:signal transduction histidine kinase
MRILRQRSAKREKRDWLIPTLLLGAIGLITAVVVVVAFFYSDLQQIYQEQIEVYLFNLVLLGFVVLAFLFIGYLALKEFASKKLKTDLVQQKINSEVLERRVTELETLHELTTLVNSQMPLSGALDSICNKALETFGAEQSSIFLYDPKTDKLLCVSVYGPKSDVVRNAAVGVGKSVAGFVIKNRQPLYLDRDADLSQFDGFVEKDKKISSSLCVPLLVQNEARGVLNITLFDQQTKLSESDLKLASIFAENAAIAIDKAGLYEELEKHAETVKKVVRELKATKDESVKPETLCALSNLACGMAHDFGYTLAAIMDKIQALLKEIGTSSIPEQAKRNALKLLKAAEGLVTAGSETAKHVGAFAGTFEPRSKKRFEELNLNAIVEDALAETASRCKEQAGLKDRKIETQTELGEDLSNPMGNHAEIKDVLKSIIFNSFDALPEGGRIKVVTKMREDNVEVSVIDNGVGMSEEVKKRVFEPFFTSKGEGGHGIGLSVAQGIISRHGGRISVESQLDVGTAFTVTLPSNTQEQPSQGPVGKSDELILQ